MMLSRNTFAIWLRIHGLSIFFVAALTGWTAADQATTNIARGSHPDRIALLVGVQSYPNLEPRERLDGCRNDVESMKELLLRFGFQQENIIAIVDDEAKASTIRENLKSLVYRVQSLPSGGSQLQIVFFFSGHGSLMPDQPEGDPDCDKEDGVDTTIVPYDADKQGSEKDIRDDEIIHFAEDICQDSRAKLLIILDCCHSGRGVRGVGKFRGLERSFPVPQPIAGGKRKVTPKVLPAGAVILSACRKVEKEPEYEEGGQNHGLMTFFLTRLLNKYSAVSNLDYEVLRAALIRQYQEAGVVQAPTPTLEGLSASLRSPFLGVDASMDRPPFWQVEVSDVDSGIVKIEAGMPHGVTKGSLYEIFEKPEQVAEPSDKNPSTKRGSIGWARVETVDGATSSGTTFVWDESGKEQVEQPLANSFRRGIAVERYHHYGDIALKIRVVKALSADSDGPPIGPDDKSLPAVVRDSLTSIRGPNESNWLTWVTDKSPCDVLLRIDGNYAAIVPASGRAIEAATPNTGTIRQVPASLVGGWGPIELMNFETVKKQLRDYLWRFARVRNLLRLTSAQNSGPSPANQIQLELLSMKLDKPDPLSGKYGGILSSSLWPHDEEESLLVKNGDYFAIRVKNNDPAKKPWYVTILLIDPNMQIQTMFPDREVIGELDKLRVDPGDENARTTVPFVCTPPFGRQIIVAIATREPNNFAFLEQPALPTVKGDLGNGTELFELVVENTYFKTRSAPMRPQKLHDGSWSASTLSWDAKP